MSRLLITLLLLSCAAAQSSIDSAEYQARRRAAMEKIPDGIVVLRAVSGRKHRDESGFHQEASLYYFTGLANVHGANLALDGTEKESWLGDFGRTIPVSSHFDEGQRETIELLNGAYLAGVSKMRPGASPQDIYKTTISYVDQHQTELKSATAKEAAANFLKQPQTRRCTVWESMWQKALLKPSGQEM